MILGDDLSLDKKQIEDSMHKELQQIGFEPVVIQWAGTQKRPIIRLRIDTLGQRSSAGVTIADCTRASRHLEEKLEQEQMLPETYVLEVSSPGVNRPLVKLGDWERFVGESVAVQTQTGEGQRSRYEGKLLRVNTEKEGSQSAELQLEDGTELRLELCAVKKANLLYEW